MNFKIKMKEKLTWSIRRVSPYTPSTKTQITNVRESNLKKTYTQLKNRI